MQLLTNTLIKRFAEVGNQEDNTDPIVIAKFFNPCGAGTWLATEYNQEEQLFFGYVSIFGDHCDEWGYFSLKELEDLKLPYGLSVERDLHFKETPVSKLIPCYTKN
jgi:hypothetical protein